MDIQARIEELQEQESSCARDISGRKTALYQAQNTLSHYETEINKASNKIREYTNLKHSFNTLGGDLGTLKTSLSDLATNLKSLGSGNFMQEILVNVRQKSSTVTSTNNSTKSIIASIDEKLKYYNGQLDYYKPLRDGIQREIKSNEQYIAKQEEILERIRSELREILGSY